MNNACNGDLLRYNDTTLLHSIPNSMKRENLSILFPHPAARREHRHLL
ncbi:MAG: hypothetical protein IKZ52_04995 [Bacteroidales bacterium]|nr:hypothetical protein [Bacteroidales bacterium]